MSEPDVGHARIILFVDDSDSDAALFEAAAAESDQDLQVLHFREGVAAMRYLLDPKNALPDATVLDIELPDLTGPEVLAIVRGDSRLRGHPMIMITGGSKIDHSRTYLALGADSVLSKGHGVEGFRTAVRLLISIWDSRSLPAPAGVPAMELVSEVDRSGGIAFTEMADSAAL